MSSFTIDAPDTGTISMVGPNDHCFYRMFRDHDGNPHVEHDGTVLVVAYREGNRSFPHLLLVPQANLIPMPSSR